MSEGIDNLRSLQNEYSQAVQKQRELERSIVSFYDEHRGRVAHLGYVQTAPNENFMYAEVEKKHIFKTGVFKIPDELIGDQPAIPMVATLGGFTRTPSFTAARIELFPHNYTIAARSLVLSDVYDDTYSLDAPMLNLRVLVIE